MSGFSDKKFKTRPPRSNGVILGTLLQATRGMLLIVFNWMILVHFTSRSWGPEIDFMAIAPPSIYFIIGVLDILTANWVWKRSLNGWRYGIAMSTIITLLTPFTLLILIYVTSYLMGLYLFIDLFAAAEAIALLTLDARRFNGAKSFL